MQMSLREGAVKRFREELGVSQGQLAEKAGISRATVNRIERGHADSATFAIVNKIAAALRVDADMLVSFERKK